MARRELEVSDDADAAELYDRLAQPHQFRGDPRRQDVIPIPLDAGNRAVITEALAFWHDHGPRQRDTRETSMAMLQIEKSVDAARRPALPRPGASWDGPTVEEVLASGGNCTPIPKTRYIDVIDVDTTDD